MTGLAEEEFAAVGRAVIAFATLENAFLRLSAVNFNPSLIKDKACNQSDMKKAVRDGLSTLLTNAVRMMEQNDLAESIKDFVEENLRPKSDAHDTKMGPALMRWRNTLVHGAYKKQSDGNILIEFHDRSSFDSLDGDEHLIRGQMSVTTNAADLNQLTLSVADFTKYLLKVFKFS